MKLTTMEESNARKRNIKPIQKGEHEVDPGEQAIMRVRQQSKWQRENTDQITIRPHKRKHIKQLIKYRNPDEGMTEYVISAILEKLERDGIDIHMFDE